MAYHSHAGLPARPVDLCDIPRLISSYYQFQPTADCIEQQVSFGTSGHRGSSFKKSFNETHILAITQAIADYRNASDANTCNGPVFVGKDTHALSDPAFGSVVQVLVANGITLSYQKDSVLTPTPVISQDIPNYNQGRSTQLADGLVTPHSHNPPHERGIKYTSHHDCPPAATAP